MDERLVRVTMRERSDLHELVRKRVTVVANVHLAVAIADSIRRPNPTAVLVDMDLCPEPRWETFVSVFDQSHDLV